MNEPGPRLTPDEEQLVQRSYEDLKQLAANCSVPSVRAAARAALAQMHAALSGQGLGYELYTASWEDDERVGEGRDSAGD